MQNRVRFTSGGVRKAGGFTLIELMIVVVIIGILAAFAYPSYQNQVRETRRTEAKAALLDTAQRLERCYTRFAAYNDAGCDIADDLPFLSNEDFYEIDGIVGAGAFTLSAAPQGDQVNDAECGTLTLTNAGVEGADGDADVCW